MRYAFLILIATAPAFAADPPKPEVTRPDEPMAKKFSLEKGTEFLDGINLAWTRERKCFSCHTNVYYMHARPLIKGEKSAVMSELRSFLEDRAANWETKPAGADYNVLATAMALAGNDAATTGKLHPLTKKALDWSIKLQKADGRWNWPKCGWPPMEHDDYYGVVFMTIAIGIAPENYAKTDAAKSALDKSRDYLKKNPAPDLHHKAMLLWASMKVDGLMTPEERQATIKQLLGKQHEDGGWCLPSLGEYHRRDKEKTLNDPNAPSDGYATGYVTYVLRQAGLKADDDAMKKSVNWLLKNQRESGRWYTRSVNTDTPNYISHAGCAFVILALNACGVLNR